MSVTTTPVESIGFDYRAAERFTGVSEKFLRREYQAGRLKGFKVGNRVRFHRDDLEAWLNLLRAEEAQRRTNGNDAEPETEPEAARPRRRRRRVAA